MRDPLLQSPVPVHYNLHTPRTPKQIVVRLWFDGPNSKPVLALVDTGATESYVDVSLLKSHQLTTSELPTPIVVHSFDGSPHTAGPITQQVAPDVHFGPPGVDQRHSVANVAFFVTKLPTPGPQVILGYDFAELTHLQINWKERSLSFPRHFLRRASTVDYLSAPDDLRPDWIDKIDYEPPESSKLRELIPSSYHDFIDVFSKERGESLPSHAAHDIKLDLFPDAIPPFGGIYRLAAPEQKTLKDYIDDMLAKGLIRESSSRAASPVLFVPKADGSVRLCVDYRKLNTMTVPDRYPLPSADMLFDRLSHAKIFTKLDLRSAYHRIRVAEGDEWKTAFRTRYGLFEYLVMPFGLTNAPAVFQRHVNDVLREYVDRFVIVYLDDILIYSEDETTHQQHVKDVLRKLRGTELYAKVEKCDFHTNVVEYLGFRISPNGLEMDPAKVSTIMAWKPPVYPTGVRKFLGFANFYRRFILNYSTIASPLFNLIKKDVNFKWDDACQHAFEYLKARFTSGPILQHFVDERPTRLETDASDVGIGAVLLQQNDDKWHPIAFASRTMSPAERNYEVHDKEMLAVVYACLQWRPLLLSLTSKFEILTDHRGLQWFMSTKDLNRRQVRWAERLADFKCTITYRPGTANGQADALSRRDDVYPLEGGSSSAANNPHNHRQFFQPHHLRLATISYDADGLFNDLRTGQLNDPEIVTLRSQAGNSSPYSVKNDLLHYEDRIVVPNDDTLKVEILRSRHDHRLAGHPGRTKTLQMVRRDFHWKGISDYVIKYVAGCFQCLRTKTPRHKKYGKLQPLPIPERPWSSISMDFIDQLPSSNGFDAILVVVDRLTKMGLFIPTTTAVTSEGLARLYVQYVFSKHGVPSDIVSDRGNKFTSAFWKHLNESLGIQQNLSTAYHPETDGQTERVNQVVETYLRFYINYDQNNWDEFLPLAEFAYNNATHSSTTESPFFLNKGFHPTLNVKVSATTKQNLGVTVDRIRQLHEHAKDEIKKALAKNVRNANTRRLDAPSYAVGDQVFLSTSHIRTTRPTKKFAERRLGPFKIIQVVSPLAMKLDLPAALKAIHPVFHVSLLEPAPTDDVPGRRQPPPEPVILQGEEEWDVRQILDSKFERGKLQYLVEWEGFDDDEHERRTWQPAENLDGAQELVTSFHASHPNKPSTHSLPASSQRRSTRKGN